MTPEAEAPIPPFIDAALVPLDAKGRAMALTKADKQLTRLIVAVRKNPNNDKAWGALALAAPAVAESFRELLVARGEMTLVR